MIGYLRLFYRLAFAVVCILLITPMMAITWSLSARHATRAIMQAAFRLGARIWGMRIRSAGHLTHERPLMVVSNHLSYLDLFALGSVIPAAFTPKTEIRSWPFIGLMCRMSGCLFIDRRTSRTLENKKVLQEALAAGDVISLFPESTTSDGTAMLPFKSSFFGLTQEAGLYVQPISVVYTHLNSRPMDAAARPLVYWYGDMYFFPHMVKFLQQRSLDVTLLFHSPIAPKSFDSRKALAAHCREVVENGIREVIDGTKHA
jgi:1-acyl-sn-glycerol-3-phosphate acyltransferase